MNVSDLKKGIVYELVLNNGISYVGKFDTIVDERAVFTGLLQIVLRPMQVPETQEISMTPSLELVGALVVKTNFKIPAKDIYMVEEVELPKFIKMYEQNVEMYEQAKQHHGSNIELATSVPEHDFSIVKK
jgi:hypothetical protein